jgi:hypothetical protein
MVGNARTRDLEIVDNNAGCRWKLVPADGVAWAPAPKLPPASPAPPPSAAAPPPPAPPTPAETRVAAAAPPAPAFTGRFDGDYRGGLQLGALAPGNSYERVSEALRDIEVRVINGAGTGTVRQARCAGVGDVALKIAADGTVTGEIDALVTTTCAPLKVAVRGRFERDMLRLTAGDGGASVEFALQRAARP